MFTQSLQATELRNLNGAANGKSDCSSNALHHLFDLMGAVIHFENGAEIYGEDEPADYFYMVVHGAVRVHKLLEDGRRQISAFHMPGDFLGMDEDADHQFTAEAIGNTDILVVKRSALEAAAARDSEVARELWLLMAGKLRRASSHMLLLGRKNAAERVASFILDMASRSAANTVELPMSRQDIADYLGLTIETVSRVLTQLQEQKAIQLSSSRRICLRDMTSLQRLNG